MKVYSSSEPGHYSWCPIREESRLFAAAVPNESGTSFSLNLRRFNFAGLSPTVENFHSFSSLSPVTSIDWAGHHSQTLGYVATGHNSGQVTLFSPQQKSVISTLKVDSAPITKVAINKNQTAALLTVSGQNNVSVWDLSNIAQGKNIGANLNGKLSSAEITGATWHRKANCLSIFAVCDSAGLSTIWDIRMGRYTHSFADSQFKFPLSDICFSPTDMAGLATSSNDPRNSVVLLWDIRNTSAPQKRLHGHTGGVTKIEWPAADERILLSAGKDGKIISWDVESTEQLTSIFEPSSVMSQINWSPHYPGIVMASSNSSMNLYSFVDPSAGSKSPRKQPKFHHMNSGISVAFDGRIFQFNNNVLRSFEHSEQIPRFSEFVQLVEALENKDMSGFVARRIQETKGQETENSIWELVSKSMDPASFKEKILQQIGINKEKMSQQIQKKQKVDINEQESVSSDLFGEAQSETDLFSNSVENSLFGSNPQADDQMFGVPTAQSEEDLFADVFQPFRVIPKKDEDAAGHMIARALVAGDLTEAIECAFAAERYADAIIISSCGSKELYEATRKRYLRFQSSSLSRLITDILEHKLENFVKYAKVKDWKDILAVLCNYAGDNFNDLVDILGRRIISELNDYYSALVCFVSSHNFQMVQICLFKIYEKLKLFEGDTSSTVLAVIEKVCAMAGEASCDVIEPLAYSFLQNVIQSGHKQEAIRFLSALPTHRTLSDLKLAIVGEQKTSAVKKISTNITNDHNSYAHQPSNLFTPSENHTITKVDSNEGVFKSPSNSGAPPVFGGTPLPHPVPNPKPQVFNPSGYQTNVSVIQQPTYVQKQNPTAVPPPNSNDPRQRSRPTNYIPAPPPKVSDLTTPAQTFIPVETPSVPVQVSPQNPTYYPNQTNPPFMPQQVDSYPPYQQPQPYAPPPPAKGNIVAPPTIKIVAAKPIQPSQADMNYNMPPNPQQTFNAPPPAPPNINIPPPVHPVTVPPNIHAQPPVSQPSVMQPQVDFVKSRAPEATLDEVPDDVKHLAQGFLHFIEKAENRNDKTPQVKRSISDARSKLPLAYAAFRDGEVPKELQNELANFFQKLEDGDIAEASTIRKALIIKFMNQCRNMIVLLNYIQTSLT